MVDQFIPDPNLPVNSKPPRRGASGYISRDEPVSELVRAIIAVCRGEIVLPPTIAARALVMLARAEPVREDAIEALTEREEEVLRLLAQSLTNKDVAPSLILPICFQCACRFLRALLCNIGCYGRHLVDGSPVDRGYRIGRHRRVAVELCLCAALVTNDDRIV